MSTSTDTIATAEAPVEFVKGSWQDSLHKSATLLDRSTKARKQASNLLWTGAQVAIEEWAPDSATDVSAENLYNEVLLALGTPRKGDASKIKTVALAVRNNGLILAAHPNLSKAYGEAVRLTKTVAAQADEDDAAEAAVALIEAPKTTSSVEGAALVLLSKGIDGAVVAILDALGASNEAAHRSFMRAVSTEIAARVQAAKPKPAPKVKAEPKEGATPANKAGAKPAKAAPKSGAAKAKPVTKAAPKAKALPVPNKEKPSAEVTEPVHAGDDIPDSPVDEAADNAVSTPVVAAKPVRRAVPVRR